MPAEVGAPRDDCEREDEDDSTDFRVDKTARADTKQPHRKAKAAQKAAGAFGHFFEDHSNTSSDETRYDTGDKVSALYRIRDWRVHDVDDEDLNRQGQKQSGADEYLQAVMLDTNKTQC
jgi:Ni/Co efflux regulator RcnB